MVKEVQGGSEGEGGEMQEREREAVRNRGEGGCGILPKHLGFFQEAQKDTGTQVA